MKILMKLLLLLMANLCAFSIVLPMEKKPLSSLRTAYFQEGYKFLDITFINGTPVDVKIILKSMDKVAHIPSSRLIKYMERSLKEHSSFFKVFFDHHKKLYPNNELPAEILKGAIEQAAENGNFNPIELLRAHGIKVTSEIPAIKANCAALNDNINYNESIARNYYHRYSETHELSENIRKSCERLNNYKELLNHLESFEQHK